MQNPLNYVRPNILALEPYSTARDEFSGGEISAWLDANENPFNNGLNRYPDPRHLHLKKLIAELKGVKPEQVFIGGSGSDEAIDIIYRVFCVPGKDNVVAIAPTYGVYKVSAAINDIEYRSVLLNSDFTIDKDRVLRACDKNSKVIWICSPNNPTGNSFSVEDILYLADNFEGILAVDEAYADFSSQPSLLQYIDSHPNIIVLQTFSKAWALASLRVGMAFATKEIAEIFGKVKYPYNLNGPTQIEIAKRMETSVKEQVEQIITMRRKMEEALMNCPNVLKVYPSDANFILVKVKDANRMYDHLIEGGVIIRNRTTQPLCENCLRITIGTPQENELTINLLNNYE